ncbi:MAG: translation elongation factor Ts [SAR324 cluster bacterium]|uniref:Elongation factor Ts n=1 Tax=SAR324 cluster bacterium TaxID=2024889 RepID=A0A7X9FTR7_9DELT|nr:translation elongation factor Ts [SAR324 cluster bacterium]
MGEISAGLVKQLREMTGAGMMDCKAALQEANGSFDAAIEVLRKKGLKNIDKRASKVAAEGVMGVYSHPGDQIVAVVELNCETDFVARNPDFRERARELAMQVAAMRPRYLSRESVPQEVIEKEKEIALEQLNESQKKNADKIIPGKLEKFYEDTVLLCQAFIKDDSGKKTVQDIIGELSVQCGEKITIGRFQRFEVGEGVEKSTMDFAAEVASMVSN